MNLFSRPKRQPVDALHAEIDDARDRIAKLKAEFETVLNQRASRAEVSESVSAAVDALAARGADLIAESMQQLAAGDLNADALPAHLAEHIFFPTDGHRTELNRAANLVVMIGASTIKAGLVARIKDVPVGLDKGDRDARLVKLARELEACGTREEIAIRQIEAATGAYVDRRPDADPRIVLAEAA